MRSIDSSFDAPRDAVRHAVGRYLSRTEPQRVGEFERIFEPLYRAAEIRHAHAAKEGSEDERVDGLPFDGGILAGTLISAATWIAFQLVQARIGRIGVEERAAIETALLARAETREIVEELDEILFECDELRRLISTPDDLSADLSALDVTPDLTLLVRREGTHLTYQLKASDPSLNLNYTEWGPVALRHEPRKVLEETFYEIERLRRNHFRERAVFERLTAIGTQLAVRLLPGSLRRRLWELREQASSLALFSSEPWIPWELLTVVDANGKEPRFLGETFALTRWLCGIEECLEIPFSSVCLVAPEDSDLPSVNDEIRQLQILTRPQATIERVPALYEPLMKALRSNRFDAFHFCGHGFARGHDPDAWKIVLEAGEELDCRDLSLTAAALGQKRPMAFLNSCHSGRTSEALTGIGGFAPSFISSQLGSVPKAAAGAFVGTYWSVSDSAASRFAKMFYELLIQGLPIGETARRARVTLAEEFPLEAARAAYTVFAHPLARIRRRNRNTPPSTTDR